jgi:endonuclease
MASEILETLRRDISRRNTVLLVCSCAIQYWGRSRSVIGEGDRIILIKPDTTLIVHAPGGFKPVNWMSSPTDLSAEVEGQKILLFGQRTVKPFEEIRISADIIHGYESFERLQDSQKLRLTHTEADMRDYLAANPREVDENFRLKSKEYQTPVGYIDLYGRIGDRYACVELKSQTAGLPAALQIKRYRDWLRESLRQDVHAILMASNITPNAQRLLKKEAIAFKKFNVRKIKIEKHGDTLEKWMS